MKFKIMKEKVIFYKIKIKIYNKIYIIKNKN